MDKTIELVNSVKDIQAMPSVIVRVLKLLYEDKAGASELADVVNNADGIDQNTKANADQLPICDDPIKDIQLLPSVFFRRCCEARKISSTADAFCAPVAAARSVHSRHTRFGNEHRKPRKHRGCP